MADYEDDFDKKLAEEEAELESERDQQEAREETKVVEKVKEEKPKPVEVKEEKQKESTSLIFVVKVTTNKEEKAFEMVSEKIKKKNLDVYAVARPHGLRGYILLEAPDRENAEEAVFNLPYVKGIIPRVVSLSEIKNMIEPVATEVKVEKNDIVEIIGEPFKKEKAKIVRVNKQKGEAIVLLLGAVVPMQVTVKLDNIKVIRREEESS